MDRALGALRASPTAASYVFPIVYLVVHRDRVIALAAQHSLPAIYPLNYSTARSGGLICYTTDIAADFSGSRFLPRSHSRGANHPICPSRVRPIRALHQPQDCYGAGGSPCRHLVAIAMGFRVALVMGHVATAKAATSPLVRWKSTGRIVAW